MIKQCKPTACSGYIQMSKSDVGKWFEVKEVKPLEDIKTVLKALEDKPEAQKIARRLLTGE